MINSVEINIEGRRVIWDDNKAKINIQKHKIHFEDAARVFLDKYRIEDFDEFHSDDEERTRVIGKVKGVLVVIYTMRGDKTRLISARKATKHEEEIYYGQYFYL